MHRRILAISAALTLLIGSHLLGGSFGPGPAHAQDETSPVLEMTMGDPSAPLTVIEYASFTCPHCGSFHENTFGEFKKNYIDTGKVFFIFREVYFDQFGLYSGLVARCDGPELYFTVVDQIFKQQRSWTKGSDANGILDNLINIGVMSGIERTQIEACIADEETARSLIEIYKQNIERDGVRSTPSFIIGGDLVSGDMPYDEFSALLDARLDR